MRAAPRRAGAACACGASRWSCSRSTRARSREDPARRGDRRRRRRARSIAASCGIWRCVCGACRLPVWWAFTPARAPFAALVRSRRCFPQRAAISARALITRCRVTAARSGGPVIALGADAPHVSARELGGGRRARSRGGPTSCSGRRRDGGLLADRRRARRAARSSTTSRGARRASRRRRGGAAGGSASAASRSRRLRRRRARRPGARSGADRPAPAARVPARRRAGAGRDSIAEADRLGLRLPLLRVVPDDEAHARCRAGCR